MPSGPRHPVCWAELINVEGVFATDRAEYHLGDPVTLTLLLTNRTEQPVYVFVPRGRAGGLQLDVVQVSGCLLRDLYEEPEPGLVGETAILPGQTYQQTFPLSQWLVCTKPGTFDVQCDLPVAVATASLGAPEAHRDEQTLIFRGVVSFTIVLAAGAAHA